MGGKLFHPFVVLLKEKMGELFQDYSGVPQIICVGLIGAVMDNLELPDNLQGTAEPVASQPCELIHFHSPPDAYCLFLLQ